jgi:hypothetical protein
MSKITSGMVADMAYFIFLKIKERLEAGTGNGPEVSGKP